MKRETRLFRIREYIRNFVDTDIQNVLMKYYSDTNVLRDHDHLRNSEKMIRSFPFNIKMSDINWSWFQKIFLSMQGKNEPKSALHFIKYIVSGGYYRSDDADIVNSFADELNALCGTYWIFAEDVKPINILLCKQYRSTGKKNFNVSSFKINITSRYLYFLLYEFIMSHISMAISQKDFFLTFHESLAGKGITCISDFDITVFNSQYCFYKNLQRKSRTTGLLSLHISLLKSFYLFLLGKPDGQEILTWRDGVDLYMLQNNKFDEYYENGFRLVPLNSFDPVPSSDRWLIMPNGAEAQTTKISAFNYKSINFSHIKDLKMKEAVKHWFWQETLSIPVRLDFTNLNINFVNFIYDLRSKYHLNSMIRRPVDDQVIMSEEVFSYSINAKTSSGYKQKMIAVRRFLKHVDDYGIYKVDQSSYQYLHVRTGTISSRARDISESDLLILESKFKEKAKGNYLRTLYYIIFHIALSTEFRISQILKLKVDCVVEGSSRNQFYVVSPTKVSNGESVHQQITPYTKRFIETAISFTSAIRQECHDSSLKQHLFLHNYHANKYQGVNSATFNAYVKRTCRENGLKVYTPGNLRDTYMTRAVEYALKKGLSLLEISAITKHKKFDTTNNHYVVQKIRDYLEATYLVDIGNVDLKGNIVLKSDKNYCEEHTVDDACGYCAKGTCTIYSGIDCPMCDGFVATIDRIPFYETKILAIDKKITSAKLLHDKEHLATIKKLYVAYLERLYILKEDAQL